MTELLDAPVLVVGAGPVGATLALELARHGVHSILVDRASRPSRHPKMDFLNARSMELYRRLGLADAIRARGVGGEHEFTFIWTIGLDEPPLDRWRYQSVDEMRREIAATDDGSMPVEPYQRVLGSRLEELGRERARAHPLIDLREGLTFVDLDQRGETVITTLTDSSGEHHHLRSRFVVGCDGANSAVGRRVGISRQETGPRVWHRDVYFRSADPVLRVWGRSFLTISGFGLTLVSRDERDHWTGTFPLSGNDADTENPVEVIQRRLGTPVAIEEVITTADWEGRLTVSDAYREGAVFLAGDAAHQFFPTGGHGANTGIGDAVDLGWKLAAVVSGWGGPRLLDSYQAERRPVALFNREMCFNLLEVWRRFPQLVAEGAPRELIAGFLREERYQIENLGIHFGARYESSPVVCAEKGPSPAWHWRRIVPSTRPGHRVPSVLVGGSPLVDQLGDEFTLVDFTQERVGAALAREANRRGVPVAHLAVGDDRARQTWEYPLVLVRPDQHVAWRGQVAPLDWERVINQVSGH